MNGKNGTQVINKWSLDKTKKFILLRKKWKHLFCGKKGSAKLGWSRVAEELPFQGNWTILQKKWQNLMQKYKETRLLELQSNPETETPPITWQFYELMKEVNGGFDPTMAPLFDSLAPQASMPLQQRSPRVPPPPPVPKGFISLLRKPYPTGIYATPYQTPASPVVPPAPPTSYIIISNAMASGMSSSATAATVDDHLISDSEVSTDPPSEGVVGAFPTVSPSTSLQSSSSIAQDPVGVEASPVKVEDVCIKLEPQPLPSPCPSPDPVTSAVPLSAQRTSPLPSVPGMSTSAFRRKRPREEDSAEEDFFKFMKAREAEHTEIMRSALQILAEIRDEIRKDSKD